MGVKIGSSCLSDVFTGEGGIREDIKKIVVGGAGGSHTTVWSVHRRFVTLTFSSTPRGYSAGYELKLSDSDGTSWSGTASTAPSGAFYDFAYGNGRFVAVGTGCAVRLIPDLSPWTELKSGLQSVPILTGVAYGNGRFVAVGHDGTESDSAAYGLEDGSSTWTEIKDGLPSRPLSGVACGNGRFVAVGYEGEIFETGDGTSWTEVKAGSESSGALDSVAYGNGRFVAVGSDGDAYEIKDGSWTELKDGLPSCSLKGVAYGNGRFVAVGSEGEAYEIVDGTSTWTEIRDGLPGWCMLCDVAYGDGRFVAVGLAGKSYVRKDGSSWSEVTGLGASSFYGVAYGC